MSIWHEQLKFYKMWCARLWLMSIILVICLATAGKDIFVLKAKLDAPEVVHCQAALSQCNSVNEQKGHD